MPVVDKEGFGLRYLCCLLVMADDETNPEGQVENAETETEVRKRKYGNGNTEVRRKAAYRWPG